MKKIILLPALIVVILSIPVQAMAAKTIGVIMTGNIPYYKSMHNAFVDELTRRGFGTDKVDIAVQKPVPGRMAWINAARRFAVLEVDLIVSYGAPSTLSAMKEASRIPVVFGGVPDPAAVGISGNKITGIRSKVPIAGLIKYLKSISHFSKLGVVYSSSEKETVKQAEEVKKLEAQLGFKTVRCNVKERCEGIRLPQVDALFFTTSAVASRCIKPIMKTARAAKIPTASIISGGEDKGVILTLCADPQALGKEMAGIVADMMNGKSPSSIPVKDCSKRKMIINLREAKALGLNIPLELLTSATMIIK